MAVCGVLRSLGGPFGAGADGAAGAVFHDIAKFGLNKFVFEEV